MRKLNTLIAIALAVFGLSKAFNAEAADPSWRKPTVKIGPPVNALDNQRIGKKFSGAFENVLSQLKADGVQAINEVPLTELEAKAKGIQIQVVESIEVTFESHPGAMRRSAYWDADKKTIFIVDDKGSHTFRELSVHEHLGVLQGGDWRSDKTAEVATYLRLLEANKGNTLGASKIKKIMQLRQGQGGVTGVGGGGDIEAIFFKTDLFTYFTVMFDRGFMSMKEREFETLWGVIQVLDIEINPELPEGSYSMDGTSLRISPGMVNDVQRKRPYEAYENILVHLLRWYRSP